MADMQLKKRMRLLPLTALILALVAPSCGEIVSPTPTATPRPIGEVDTGMGGNLSVQGVVRDTSGDVAPDVHVAIAVFEKEVYWDRTESGPSQLGEWNVYTDETGSYSFDNLEQVEGGHYQVYFNSEQEYGEAYESSIYYIIREISGDAHLLCERSAGSSFADYHDEGGDVYALNVTVHPVTGSALSGVIRYEDADGITKDYFSSPLGPDHRIELNRGTSPANHEYTIGGDFTSDGSKGRVGGLAGGTYYLIFQYITSDGAGVECTSPSIEIPPGETKQFDYTIPLSSCSTVQ
jgi:hypothetical protein